MIEHNVGAAGTASMDCGCGFYRQEGKLVVARCALHAKAKAILEKLKEAQVSVFMHKGSCKLYQEIDALIDEVEEAK